MTLHDISKESSFPKLPSKPRRYREQVKSGKVTACVESGFESSLLINPIDNFAVRRVATDGLAQQLPNP